jgi:hypothetical protein
MDDATRRRLERRADRLEHRLGIITDPQTGELRPATVSEMQARAIRLGGAAARRPVVVEVDEPDEGEPEETTSARQARELLERYDAPASRESATAAQARQIRRGS